MIDDDDAPRSCGGGLLHDRVELPVPVDAFEMRLHAIGITTAAGNRHRDLLNPAARGAHAFIYLGIEKPPGSAMKDS
jgi:hypothetical protein